MDIGNHRYTNEQNCILLKNSMIKENFARRSRAKFFFAPQKSQNHSYGLQTVLFVRVLRRFQRLWSNCSGARLLQYSQRPLLQCCSTGIPYHRHDKSHPTPSHYTHRVDLPLVFLSLLNGKPVATIICFMSQK